MEIKDDAAALSLHVTTRLVLYCKVVSQRESGASGSRETGLARNVLHSILGTPQKTENGQAAGYRVLGEMNTDLLLD